LISRLVTRNFFSLFLSNVVGQLFTLWAFVRIAAVFGPDGFGKFSFAQVVGLHFLYLADFGLQTLGTRTIAQEKGSWTRHVADLTVLRVILSCCAFALLVLFAIFLPKPGDVKTLVIIFGLALFPFAVLFEWVFLGLEKMEVVGIGRILKGMLFAGLVYWCVDTPDHLNEAAGAYVAGMTMAAAVLLVLFIRKYGFVVTKPDSALLRRTLWAAIPLAAGSLIAQVNFNFGTLALGFFLPDEVVGLYSAAYKIVVFLLAFAVVAAANAVFPLMAKSYKTSTTLFGGSLKKLLRLFVFVAIPIGVGSSVLASKIMGLLYSPAYQGGVIVLQLSIWVVVIAIYRVIFENALIVSSSQRRYFTGYILAGTSTVLGNLLLIPLLGMIAPAIVGILSEVILLTVFVASCRHIRLEFLLRMTVGPLLAAILMGIFLAFLPGNVFVAVGLGILVYCVLLLLFRCITFGEVAGYMRALAQ
jgi:O-antigen/teichoic acid export membrane protein